jgi:putative aldouronate transport system permease protein
MGRWVFLPSGPLYQERCKGEHAVKRAKKFKKLIGTYGLLYCMMIPGLVYLLINNYLPMAGLVVAFKDVNFSKGIFGSDWVGLKNFEYLFRTRDAITITKNTLSFNIVFIVVNTSLSILIALMLNEMVARGFKRFYQSAILLPYLISMVIISYLGNAFMNIENGFLNRYLLPLLGIEAKEWYVRPDLWRYILVIVSAWKNIGYLSIIYYSAIIGIDTEYFEAAYIEGAGKLQQVRHITLPLIKPTITLMVMLSIGRIFYSDFGLFYQVPMNSGPLFSTTNVIDTYVYRGLMELGDIGMSSAAGLYQAIIGFCLVLISNLIVRKLNPENALF